MDENKQVSAEELTQEQNALAEVKEDEVRENIISEYGFDSESDKERIDKLVQKELGHRKSLSAAIGQKIKHRTELETLKKTPPKQESQGVKPEDIDKLLDERLEKRDLDSMEYPDDIKNAIAQVAKIDGVGVKKAESNPYIKAKIDAWKKENGSNDAAISRNNNNGAKKESDSSLPPDVDLSTEEGRKEYDKWKAGMIKKGF